MKKKRDVEISDDNSVYVGKMKKGNRYLKGFESI